MKPQDYVGLHVWMTCLDEQGQVNRFHMDDDGVPIFTIIRESGKEHLCRECEFRMLLDANTTEIVDFLRKSNIKVPSPSISILTPIEPL